MTWHRSSAALETSQQQIMLHNNIFNTGYKSNIISIHNIFLLKLYFLMKTYSRDGLFQILQTIGAVN